MWKVIRTVTSLSAAILAIILWHGEQSFIDAVAIVCLHFYATIVPVVIAFRIYRLCRDRRKR